MCVCVFVLSAVYLQRVGGKGQTKREREKQERQPEMSLSITKKATLSDGNEMPAFGLGMCVRVCVVCMHVCVDLSLSFGVGHEVEGVHGLCLSHFYVCVYVCTRL